MAKRNFTCRRPKQYILLKMELEIKGLCGTKTKWKIWLLKFCNAISPYNSKGMLKKENEYLISLEVDRRIVK